MRKVLFATAIILISITGYGADNSARDTVVTEKQVQAPEDTTVNGFKEFGQKTSEGFKALGKGIKKGTKKTTDTVSVRWDRNAAKVDTAFRQIGQGFKTMFRSDEPKKGKKSEDSEKSDK